MKKVKIITDASCDFPIELRNKYNVEIVALHVSLDSVNYVYGDVVPGLLPLETQDFYESMAKMSSLPKTACPSVNWISEKFSCRDDIIFITLSSKLSATYETAVMAKNEHNEKGHKNRVYVLDSLSGCAGTGSLVLLACQLREQGLSFDDIVTKLESKKSNIVCYGYLETLDNAIKGGRVSPVAGFVAGALNIKPIIHVTDGKVVPVDKARGTNSAINKLVDYVNNNVDFDNRDYAIVCHANAPINAAKVKSALMAIGFKEIFISIIGPVMGTYTASDAVIIGVL